VNKKKRLVVSNAKKILLVVGVALIIGGSTGFIISAAISANRDREQPDRSIELLDDARARETELRDSIARAASISGELEECIGAIKQSSSRIGDLNRSTADRIRASIELVEEIRVQVALLEDHVNRLQCELSGNHNNPSTD
jgi:hypothetical protein